MNTNMLCLQSAILEEENSSQVYGGMRGQLLTRTCCLLDVICIYLSKYIYGLHFWQFYYCYNKSYKGCNIYFISVYVHVFVLLYSIYVRKTFYIHFCNILCSFHIVFITYPMICMQYFHSRYIHIDVYIVSMNELADLLFKIAYIVSESTCISLYICIHE